MRIPRTMLLTYLTLAALNVAAYAQPPKGKAPDDAPPPGVARPSSDFPRGGAPKAKMPADRRPGGEESHYEEQVRLQSEATLHMHDRNRDGKLDRSEWSHLKNPEDLDKDNDGVITLAEIINGPHVTSPGPAFAQRGRGGVPVGPNGEIPGGPGYGGGFGGARGFGGGPMMPGMPRPGGPFGEPPPDDPEMRELMKQDAELEQQSHQVAQRVREASGEERQRIRDALADVVAKHFEVRQKRRELQIKRMEEELKRLREEIAKRNDSRKTITDNRFRELTGESRDLDF